MFTRMSRRPNFFTVFSTASAQQAESVTSATIESAFGSVDHHLARYEFLSLGKAA